MHGGGAHLSLLVLVLCWRSGPRGLLWGPEPVFPHSCLVADSVQGRGSLCPLSPLPHLESHSVRQPEGRGGPLAASPCSAPVLHGHSPSSFSAEAAPAPWSCLSLCSLSGATPVCMSRAFRHPQGRTPRNRIPAPQPWWAALPGLSTLALTLTGAKRCSVLPTLKVAPTPHCPGSSCCPLTCLVPALPPRPPHVSPLPKASPAKLGPLRALPTQLLLSRGVQTLRDPSQP